MATKRDWLNAGLDVLAADGAPALTIDRLSGALGLSKGSFYHHFDGMRGYTTALLSHFESEHTARFIEAVEQDPGEPADKRLRRLSELVLADEEGPALEVAIRAWASQNPEVGAAQERVDRTRIDYLRGLWEQIGRGPEESQQLGEMLYLLLVGAGHVRPPLPAERLRALYDLVMRLTEPQR